MPVEKVKDPKTAALYLAKYLTKDEKATQCCTRRVGGMFGFFMVPKDRLTFTHPHSDSVSYLTKFWGRGQFGREQISAIYNSVNCSGDWRTLLVGLDYKVNKRMESFSWAEDYCLDMMETHPFCDWVDYGASIYEPGRMPVLLKKQPY